MEGFIWSFKGGKGVVPEDYSPAVGNPNAIDEIIIRRGCLDQIGDGQSRIRLARGADLQGQVKRVADQVGYGDIERVDIVAGGEIGNEAVVREDHIGQGAKGSPYHGIGDGRRIRDGHLDCDLRASLEHRTGGGRDGYFKNTVGRRRTRHPPPPRSPSPAVGGIGIIPERSRREFLNGPHIDTIQRIGDRHAVITPPILVTGKRFEIRPLTRLEQLIRLHRVRRVGGQAERVIGAGVLVGAKGGIADQRIILAVHRNAGKPKEPLGTGIVNLPPLEYQATAKRGDLKPLHGRADPAAKREEDMMRTPERTVTQQRILHAGIVALDPDGRTQLRHEVGRAHNRKIPPAAGHDQIALGIDGLETHPAGNGVESQYSVVIPIRSRAILNQKHHRCIIMIDNRGQSKPLRIGVRIQRVIRRRAAGVEIRLVENIDVRPDEGAGEIEHVHGHDHPVGIKSDAGIIRPHLPRCVGLDSVEEPGARGIARG